MNQVKLQNQADSIRKAKNKNDIFDEVIEKVAQHLWHQLTAEPLSLRAVAIEGRHTLSQSGQVETTDNMPRQVFDFVLVWHCAQVHTTATTTTTTVLLAYY